MGRPLPTRVIRLLAPLLVLSAGVAALLQPGAVSARRPSGAVSARGTPAAVVTIGGPIAAPPIPAGFTGLSFELTALKTYTGKDPDAINPVFAQLVRNIAQGGRPVIRLGGDSTDWAWYPVPGMARPPWVRYQIDANWLQILHAVVKRLDARLIVGINFESDSARIAGAEARAVVRAAGRAAIAGLELGNEPELYSGFNWYRTSAGVGVKGRPAGWGPPVYNQEYRAITTALPRVPLAGPAVGNPNWFAALGSFLAANRAVKVATLHRYPLVRCSSGAHVTAGQLLSTDASDGLANSIAPYVAVARRYGDSLRIAEMNAVSCGGQPGLSDTFTTSLWAVDALFAMAKVGVAGVNIHTTPGYVNQLFSFTQNAAGSWSGSVEPLYYGLLLFAQAAPAGSRLLRVSSSGNAAVRVWATRGTDGLDRVVVINAAPGTTQTVRMSVPGETQPGTLERMTAPRLSATSGVSIAGESFGRSTTTGQLAGTPRVTKAPRVDGDYVITLHGASAALLTLGQAPYPIKPTR